jgi:hypothetical protein
MTIIDSLTFPIANKPLSKRRMTPSTRKAAPNPTSAIPISARN